MRSRGLISSCLRATISAYSAATAMAHRLTMRGKKSFGKRFLPMAKSWLVPRVGRTAWVTCCSRGPNPRRVRDTKSSRGFRGRCVINSVSFGSVGHIDRRNLLRGAGPEHDLGFGLHSSVDVSEAD